MEGVTIGFGINSDRADLHLATGADDAACDLATVCDEDLAEHNETLAPKPVDIDTGQSARYTLFEHRIALIPGIITNTDLGPGSVFQRVSPLLFGKKFGRFKIHSVERVDKKNYLVTVSVDLIVNYPAVGDPAVLEQEPPAFCGMVTVRSLPEKVKKSHLNP
jgi:hypothetical protein